MSESITEQPNHSPEGDRDFIKSLFDEYYADLVVFCMKYVIAREIAEEIVQDVFVKLWNNINKYKIEKTIKGYLFTAVKNNSINYLKSKFARIRFVGLDSLNAETSSVSFENEITAKELNDLITRAVNLLPPRCRIIFNLSRNAGLSYDEIAREMNISRRTVETQISIAIKKIKNHLDKWWDDVPS